MGNECRVKAMEGRKITDERTMQRTRGVIRNGFSIGAISERGREEGM
jgi:hypothetical protein